MTPEEIENVRRMTWRKHQDEKAARRRENGGNDVHRRFSDAQDFAAAGFGNRQRIGFSGFGDTLDDGAG